VRIGGLANKMNLIHTCPRCGKEHEYGTTPEPDKLCPECLELQSLEENDPRDLTGRKVISRPVEVREIPNNCFCKERCCLCTYIFDADSTTIYELTGVGLICYGCAGKLKFLDDKEVDTGIPMSYDEAVKRSLKNEI
jgi:hypothetical protein